MKRIDSVQNPLVKRMRALKGKAARDAQARMLIEGEKLIGEALDARLTPYDAFVREDLYGALPKLIARLEGAGADVYAAPERVLDAMCDTVTPQGICASFALPETLDLARAPDKLVALDGVQDPGNAGTIWRTADAAGYGALLLGRDTADAFSPKVQRAAMGSGFRVAAAPVALKEALMELKERGYQIIAAALGGVGLYDRPPARARRVVVIGGEARGVSAEILALSDMVVQIPMRGGAESLNAAVAAGIVLYEMMRDEEDAK